MCPSLWNTDLRRSTALAHDNDVLSPSFNTLAHNLSPRIVRVGLVVGF